jgi:hypothetical protein
VRSQVWDFGQSNLMGLEKEDDEIEVLEGIGML